MKVKIKFDEFVKSVRPDPKSTDQLTIVAGFIGESSEKGHIRVYSDPELSDFIEIPEEGIVHCIPFTPEENPIGGSKIWVRKDSVFISVSPGVEESPKMSFLEGDIINSYFRDFDIGNPTGPIIPPGPCIGTTPIPTLPCKFNTFMPPTGCAFIKPTFCITRTPIVPPTGCAFIKPTICINKTPLVPCITNKPTTGDLKPLCVTQKPTICLVKPTCKKPDPTLCLKTIDCIGFTKLDCFQHTGITITAPPTGCGLNYSTLPPTTFFEQQQAGIFNTGQVGYVTPTEPITPWTPTTPIVRPGVLERFNLTGYRNFNPFGY